MEALSSLPFKTQEQILLIRSPPEFYFIYFKINLLFIYFYFWLRWVFVAVRGLLIEEVSLVVEHGL